MTIRWVFNFSIRGFLRDQHEFSLLRKGKTGLPVLLKHFVEVDEIRRENLKINIP